MNTDFEQWLEKQEYTYRRSIYHVTGQVTHHRWMIYPITERLLSRAPKWKWKQMIEIATIKT